MENLTPDSSSFTVDYMPDTMIQVKNGVIKLPKLLQKAWKDARISIHVYRNKAILEGPVATKRKYNLTAWRKAAGILKNKRIPNPTEWQRKIRSEWERDVS